jgi:hypothetical protein
VDAPATELHVSHRNRFLVKRAEWVHLAGAVGGPIAVIPHIELQSRKQLLA